MSIPQSTYHSPLCRNPISDFDVHFSTVGDSLNNRRHLQFIRDISLKLFRLLSIPDQDRQEITSILSKNFDYADSLIDVVPTAAINKVYEIHNCLVENWDQKTLTDRINREVQALFKTLNSSMDQLIKPSPLRIKEIEKKHKEPEEHSQNQKSQTRAPEKGKISNVKKAHHAQFAKRIADAEAAKRNQIGSNADSIWDNSDDELAFSDF